ncbi:hemagglutinin repeat-containing protein [Pseudomonas corrugata]|uniref:two-partner secretion domain-containing protein n=3 Tax=Pseudomonas corrugata TaxID=47879 RepID=UPI0018E62B61|nr:hemagglutinin repeat-containing protein [Pseudomonas corrugata]MBI6616786.1 hemagglutinin repeat-containing protein [Pseudomonas corrugata]
MDDRQYAFLARQPSAALKNRERFLGMPKRGLAFLLANVMFWQPMWAQAEGIVVSAPGTGLDRAGNGVPIVNIAKPNANGLSHNQFKDYNVDSNGVILNNATNRTQSTQLGGIILGNPNLKGSAAQTILNEVNGGNPSQLRGYTEVAGQSAHVIVANPYGITCNGCGFINSPKVTLSTGKPVVENGRLDRYQVDQGSVAIEGAGLNASNVDHFEIITRSAKINAEIQAKNLTIVAGRNDVNAETLSATARADDGSAKPELAIDSSALGGMYAGAIKLVGTEAGVGVKLDGKLIASGGDIQLDANGRLSMVDTSASGAVNVKAASVDVKGPVYAGTTLNAQVQGDLVNRQTLAARDGISLSAGGQLSNNGIIEAGVNADNTRNASGDVSVTANTLDNHGKSIVASRNLTANIAQTLNNQGGTLSAGQTATVKAGTLDNQNKGRVLSNGALGVTADKLLNTQGIVSSNGNLTANVGQLNNHDGEVSSAATTQVIGTALDNSDGLLTGDVALNIGLIGALNNRNGVLGSGKGLTVTAASLDNTLQGSLVSDGSLTTRISGLFDNRQGSLGAKGSTDVQAGSLDNRDGRVQSVKDLQLTVARLDNREQGLLSSQAGLRVDGSQLDNRGGLLSAAGPVHLQVTDIDNSGGRISSKTDLTANVSHLNNQGGELVAQGLLTVSGQDLNNRGGLVGATNALKLDIDALDNRGGEISSTTSINITGQGLNNSDGGKVLAGTDLGLKVAAIINQTKGLLFSTGVTTVEGKSLDNSGANLVARLGLDIRLDGALINVGGAITTEAGLTVSSQSLDNHGNGLLSAKGAIRVTTGTFDNTSGGYLVSGDTLDLTANQVNNGAGSRIASDNALTASVTGLDQQGGELFSKTALTLDLNNGQLNNLKGVINAPLLVLKNLKDVNNRGGEISSAQAFTLAARNLDNRDGKLISNQALTLRIDQALNTIKGLVSAQSIDTHSASLDNSGGLISSRGTLVMTVDGQLTNRDAAIIADGDLHIEATHLDNSAGQIAGKTNVTATIDSVNNQGGQMIALGGLTLTGASLDNRAAGLVGATDTLTLNVGSIDNRGGELSGHGDVALTGDALDNSDGGQVIANGALALTVQEVLNRTKGLLSGKTGLTLTGETLDNSGGALLTQKNLTAHLDGDLNNAKGTLSAEGTLEVTAASLINTLGSVSSAGALALTLDNALLNQGGEIVTDAGLTFKSASLDNRNQGSISAKQAVTVETGAFDNSQAGQLSSGTHLDLTAKQLTNQDGGRIASSGALSASVTGLDQQGGQLFSNTSLSLDLNQGQLNNQNGLINAPLLMLKNLKGVNNAGGEISSAQAFTLAAQNLNNDNGKLLSNQALTLRIDNALTNLKGLIAAAALDVEAASLDNSAGTLTSRANLDLKLAGPLINQSQGLINAADALTVSTRNLNNHQGSLLGSAIVIDFGAATGDLNNSAGLITTAGVLSLKHLRDLDNQGGEISSSQPLDLTARDLNNSAGKLISNGLLTVKAHDVINQGGLMSGFKGLDLSATSLDNRNAGTLSSRDEDVSVTLSGALLNSADGAVAGKKNLTVTAASVDNRGGILSSGADQTLTVTGGLLNNAQGGLIDSAATLVMNAMTLGNAGGTVNAQQALTFTGTTLDNTGGTLIGNAAVTLDLLGALTNTNGKLASTGPLRVERATQINNQGGQIASQGLLTLLIGGLDNRNRGTVAANDALILTASGAVQNGGDGLIYSQNGTVQIDANSLANGKGTVQSQGNLTLVVDQDIDNQSGRIQAKAGDLTIEARNLDNRGGVLASLQGLLKTDLSGVLKNGYDLNNNRQGGITQAQRLNLIALGGLDNYGGRISAQTGDAVITTGNVDNRNGGLYAKGKVNVTANNFDNSGDNGGQIAGSQIDLNLTGAMNNRLGVIESDSTLMIKAASLDNQTGQIRALGTGGKTHFQIGGLFDNRSGVLESANTDLTLGATSFLNTGGSLLHVGTGTFDISTANVTGAGGTVVTRGGLTISTDTWTNSGVIQAGRLSVNVNHFTQTAGGQLLASDSFIGGGVNWFNEGLVASNGSLKIDLGGAYWGGGRLNSLGTLGLSAAQVSLNSVSSSITGGGDTTIGVNGQLDNAGRLTSAARLTIGATGINNFGTLGGGQALTVTTGALANHQGLIFSGGDMGLRVDTLNNLDASIYSLGNLTVDRNGLGALASSIVNSSSSIQSDGSMSLAASTIQNIRTLLTMGSSGIYTAKITELPCIEGYNAGDCSGKQNHVWELLQREKTEVTAATAASSITAGGNLNLSGGDLLNQSSTIASGGNLTASLVNLTNTGVETGETETTRVLRSQRTRNAGAWYTAASNFTNKYWFESAGYDVNNLSSLEAGIANFIGMTEMEYTNLGTTKKLAGGDQSYAAVIQAGGAVNINAQNNINNSVVRPGYTYIGSGPRTNTGASGTAYSTRITLNQQLPPNLAQQQVNPVALPGFSLPIGQNGLFRLSGQSGAVPAVSGPQSWALGNASLTQAQRQQGLPAVQARDLQPGNAPQATASNLDLSIAARQATNIGDQASTFDTSTGGAPVAGAMPGRTTAFTVNRVQGLPASTVAANPHKYLIEANPVLTDLKQFMSSDYLLSNLGYDPDQSAKRLGDGLYEQTLIQQAVVARTGQRFIDGQTSNEDMFKYLMNNAIASKQALNLALGVSLTSEQVAALTHDIVWMENVEVDGEQVLVPVLYLANANNRLAANGALIQGSDVTLIAGKDLDNAGTLRASNNLSATATNDLVNSGLVEAGNRLDLLAGNNLVNKAGGIIAGRDVTLTATRGDVINERTVTTHESDSGYRRERTDFIDSASRIEAANNLTISAGRDINNVGGVLKSGADTTLNATRDVNLASAERITSGNRGTHRNETITQYGSSLDIGRDLTANAGRDLTAVASQIDAKRDITMSAIGDLTLASAADEQHSYGKSKKVTAQEDHVSQVSTSVTAGGNVALSAGKDLGLIASRVSAGDEAYLVAGANLVLQSAEDSDYSFYSKTKKSSSGKKFRLDETSSVTNVASSVTSGGNNVLTAGNDLLIKGSNVISEKGSVGLGAGNDVEILAVTDSESARHERSKSKSSWGGLKSSKVQDKLAETQTTAVGSLISGDTIAVSAKRDATVTGSALVSTNDLAVRAGRDLTIDAAENTFSRTQMHKEKNRDLTGVLTANNLGLDDITGNQHLSISNQKHNGTASQTTLTGSTIGSSKGNVSLVAGGDLNVIASDLVSTKNMSLRGSNVTIAAGMETAKQSTADKSSSLAVGRVVGGAIIDTVNTIRSSVEAAKDADDPRLKAVKLAQAALAAYNLGGMASEANDQKTGFADKQGGTASNGSLIKIGTELASTHSKSTSDYASQTAKQSTLNAGATLSIIANGNAAENDGDLHVIGSSIKATNTSLLASNDIILESAQNTADWSNRNSNNKTAIGASFNIGQQNGFTLDLGAQLAKGMGNGSSVTQVNTTVDTGSLLLRSGGDTTLAGAQVRADEIDALIDGNLNIISRQDTQDQKSKQSSGGFGASICIPPFCYGTPVAASANLAAGNMNSEYKGVTDQTGLFAGAGGYTVDVGKTTTLEGGVIASDASADKNLLITDRLIARDIKNVSEIEAQSAGIGISGSYGGAGASASVGGLYGIALSESDKSHTRSAVSEGTIIVRNPEGAQDTAGLNRDTKNANEHLDKPDEEAMNERIELVKSSIELVKGISSAIAAEKIKEAEDKNSDAYKVAQQKLNDSGVANPTPEQISQQVQRDYGTGSSFQKASQAVAGIVQGILVGDIGALIGGAAAPYLAQAVKQLTEGDDTANLMAHAVLGAVLAKAQGGSALAGAAGASVGELIASQLYPGKSREELTESEKQTIAALSTLAGGLSGALAGGDAFNAALGAGTAKNAVENNHLSDIERLSLQALQREYESSCNGSTTSDCQDLSGEIAELIAKNLSVLKDEVLSEDNDFTRAMVHTTSPGDVISCATSPNGFCVATDKTITTDRGEEWVLQPASFEQAIEGKTRNDLDNAIITAQLQGVSNELFSAGCGGAGVAGVACQGFMAAGGENPITGEVASNTERVMWGIQGLLNIWGLGGSIFSGGAKGFTSDLTEVWGLKPTQRGVAIESYLARTEYSAKSGWYNVGAERNGYFPLVDFQNGNTLVSLKSVDTAGGTWLNRMQDHIIDLGTNGAKVNGNPASMVLDLRVQPGGLGAAKSLIDFGREYNVKVIIKEFK